MNRRKLFQGWLSMVLLPVAAPMSVTAKQATPAPNPDAHYAWVEWVSDDDGLDVLLLKYFTRVSAFNGETQAAKAYYDLLSGVDNETLISEEAPTYGDESFFVEYSHPYLYTYRATVRLEHLLYEFEWETQSNVSGSLAGHRVMESALDRAVIKAAYTDDELQALLPTEDEVTEFGSR